MMVMGKMRNNKELGGSPEKIRAAALRMLTRRPYAKKELARRLIEKGAQKEAALNIVSALEEQGLINDEKMAEAFIHYRKSVNTRGGYYILRELIEKGVNKELAADSLEEYYPQEEERENLKKLIKKNLKALPADKIKRKRQINNLIRKMTARGFALGMVFEILEEEGLDSLDNDD